MINVELRDLRQRFLEESDEAALDRLLGLLTEDNREILPAILDSIHTGIDSDTTLDAAQLDKIKPFLDDYEEDVQKYALTIYTESLKLDLELASAELEYCFEKLEDFEPVVRDDISDLLLELFTFLPEQAGDILKVLITRLMKEPLWKMRLKLVDFLNRVYEKKAILLLPWKHELEGLLDETDIDVSRESREFLYRLMSSHFSSNDLEKLLLSLPDRSFAAQKTIIWLIGNLGVHSPELIAPITPKLLDLLDSPTHELQKYSFRALTNILKAHPVTFTEYILQAMKQNRLENAQKLELLAAVTIEHGGFPVFETMYRNIENVDEPLFDQFTNVVKILDETDRQQAMRHLFNLLKEIFQDFSAGDQVLLEAVLARLSRSHFFFLSYCILEKREKPDEPSLPESNFQQLLEFLVQEMPDLEVRFKNMQEEEQGLVKTVHRLQNLPTTIQQEIDQLIVAGRDIAELKDAIEDKFTTRLAEITEFEARLKAKDRILFSKPHALWDQAHTILRKRLDLLKEEMLADIKAQKVKHTQQFSQKIEEVRSDVGTLHADFLGLQTALGDITQGESLETIHRIANNLGPMEAVRSRISRIELKFNAILDQFPNLPEVAADLIVDWAHKKKQMQLFLFDIHELTVNLVDKHREDPLFDQIQAELHKDKDYERIQQLQEVISTASRDIEQRITKIQRLKTTLAYDQQSPQFLRKIRSIESANREILKQIEQYEAQITQIRSGIDFNRLDFVEHFHASIKNWEDLVHQTIARLDHIKQEVKHHQIGAYIHENISQGTIDFSDVERRFHVSRKHLVEILNALILDGQLSVDIADNQIVLPQTQEDVQTGALGIFKKLHVTGDPETGALVNLSVKVESLVPEVNHITIYLRLPSDLFELVEIPEKQRLFHDRLVKNEFFIKSWTFRKVPRPAPYYGVASINLILLFRVEEKFSTLVKKIEVLLL